MAEQVRGTAVAGRPGRKPRRRLRPVLVILLVLLVLVVAADFLAMVVAQDKLASEIQQHGFPQKPSVTIEGYPFLTQVVSHDIRQVRISARNVPEGPLRISVINAVMTGIHLDSGFTSGTVDTLSGSLLVTFPALANALTSQIGPLGSVVGSAGLRLSRAGPGEVKASLNLLVVSGSATWRISRLSGRELGVRLVASTGVPSSLLGSIRNVTVPIPALPLGVTIGSVAITPAGVSGRISGHDLPFGSGAAAGSR